MAARDSCGLAAGDDATLIDTGYHTGVAELRDWTGERASGPVRRILLTHAHSDHAGCVAAIVAETGARVMASEGTRDLAARWDEIGLWLGPSGQEMPRFAVDEAFGDVVEAGEREWRVIPTPGHIRSAVALFAEGDGVLVTGDALWESAFGLLDPWIEGMDCFERTAEALERLRALSGVRVVVPGHGKPFADFVGALDRADARLAALRARPDAIRRQVVQSGVSFLGMARPELPRDELRRIVLGFAELHAPFDPGPDTPSAVDLVDRALDARA